MAAEKYIQLSVRWVVPVDRALVISEGWRIPVLRFALVEHVNGILDFSFGLAYTSQEKAKCQSLDDYLIYTMNHHTRPAFTPNCWTSRVLIVTSPNISSPANGGAEP